MPRGPATDARRPLLGYAYAIAAAVLFGSNGSVAKVVIASGIDARQLTFLRVLAGALLSALVLLVGQRSGFWISRRQLGTMLILGVLGVAMVQWLYAISISRVPVGISLLIEYTAVLMVALWARFVFRENVRGRLWAAIALVLIGLAIVAQLWSTPPDTVGVITAALAAVAYALYFLVAERGVSRMTPIAVSFWSMGAATVFWSVGSGWWHLSPGTFARDVSLQGHLTSVHVALWVPLAWTLVMGSFAPFLLSFLALGYLSATNAGILATSEVLVAFVVAWLWLGESLSALQLVGAGVVFVGIVIAQTARVRKVIDLDLAASPPDVSPPATSSLAAAVTPVSFSRDAEPAGTLEQL